MSEGSERVKEYFEKLKGEPSPFRASADPLSLRNIHICYFRPMAGEHAEPEKISENWEDAFGDAVDEMIGALAERQDESAARLQSLEEAIKTLKKQLEQESKSILVPIETFDPDLYALIRSPVLALVLPEHDSFVASLVDANVNASGDTIPDAVENLKDMMILLFERLSKESQDKLGKGPKRQLAILRGVMRRKPRHAAHRQ